MYLIHWPTDLDKEGWPTHEEAWKQLEKVKEAGLARVSVREWAEMVGLIGADGWACVAARSQSIGVSNFRRESFAGLP